MLDGLEIDTILIWLVQLRTLWNTVLRFARVIMPFFIFLHLFQHLPICDLHYLFYCVPPLQMFLSPKYLNPLFKSLTFCSVHPELIFQLLSYYIAMQTEGMLNHTTLATQEKAKER